MLGGRVCFSSQSRLKKKEIKSNSTSEFCSSSPVLELAPFGVDFAVGGAIVDEGVGAGAMIELPAVDPSDTVTTF
jgi:hypothetical protein